MRLKKTYSSREVAALTGLTARQLQLWDAGGLLTPTIPSHKTAAGGYTERRYTPIELFELLALADLRRRGFSVHQLHQILRILREQFGQRLFDGALVTIVTGREPPEGQALPTLICGNERFGRKPLQHIETTNARLFLRAVVDPSRN